MGKVYKHPEPVDVWLRWNDENQQPEPWDASAWCETTETIAMAVIGLSVYPPEETGLEQFTVHVVIEPGAVAFTTWAYEEMMGGWTSEWAWGPDDLDGDIDDLYNVLYDNDPKAVWEEYRKLKGGLVEIADQQTE